MDDRTKPPLCKSAIAAWVLFCVSFVNIVTDICQARVKYYETLYPQDGWTVSIIFSFISNDILAEYTGKEVSESWNYPQIIYIRDDGSISLDMAHPFISKQSFFQPSVDGFSTVGFITAVDQSSICGYAIDALCSMIDCTSTFTDNDCNDLSVFDKKGYELSIHLAAYGIKIEGDCYIDKGQPLPNGIKKIFSILRRTLPPSYEDYFNYLNIPVMSPLTEKERKEIKKCLLHNRWMGAGDVPIIYGLLISEEDYAKAEALQFPNDNSMICGGCVKGNKTHDLVLYCPDCRQAKAQWLKENNRKEEIMPQEGGL